MFKILVVDDEKSIREVIRTYAEFEGHEVVEARDGLEAIDKVREEDFDVIVMDIMMPKLDGIAATKAIRDMERPDAVEIPIIAMTANAFEEDARKCVEAGMNAHLSKPLQMDVVVGTIAQYYKRWLCRIKESLHNTITDKRG